MNKKILVKKILVNNNHEYNLKIKSRDYKESLVLKTTNNDCWSQHYQNMQVAKATDSGDDITLKLNGESITLDYLESFHFYLLLKHIHESDKNSDTVEFE